MIACTVHVKAPSGVHSPGGPAVATVMAAGARINDTATLDRKGWRWIL